MGNLNALDNQTEQIIMELFNNLSNNITMIILTYPLNTFKNYDTIFKFEKGKIIWQGIFSKLIKENKNLIIK
jgi:ABC-type multidrug transport system fused ATPase/permease subunit